MSTNVTNQVAFLRTTREFPEDLHQFTVEVNKTYVDIANAVNNRTISIFPTNRPAINGESWFLTGNQRQQGLRQIYALPSTIVNGSTIDIGFKISSISQFTSKCYGSFTDGTNWYGLIYASNIAITAQISFYITLNGASTTSDQVTFRVGAGAPAIASGTLVLEWISRV